jgi:hypothetical protein
MFKERSLKGREGAIGETFDGSYLPPRNGGCRYQAGAGGLPVKEHCAGPAIAGVAADFGSCQVKLFPEHSGETRNR